MKIALINTSDTLGGAAIVTYRLMEALRNAGHDARMVTFVKYGDSRNGERHTQPARQQIRT